MATKTKIREDDGSSFATRFLDRFKLSSHSEMERFSTIVLVFLITGALIFTLMGVQIYRGSRANINDRAVYTTKFLTSRTQQPGEVFGVYSNANNSRAVVLFNWSAPERMSSNAEDYDVFVSGVNVRGFKPEKTLTPMTGEVVSFGRSGVMGVVLDTPQAFNMQVLNLTIHAKKELAPVNVMDEETLAEAGYDKSFTTNDGFRLIFNPAGKQRVYIPALDSDEFNVRDFFDDTMMLAKEQDTRKKLDVSLQRMKTAQDRILNFYQQAEVLSTTVGNDANVKLIPPAPPAQIAGDDVVGQSGETLKLELNSGKPGPAMESLKSKSERAIMVDTYDDGYMPNTYKLNTTTVIPNGFNFDWRDKTIGDGYLKDLVPSGTDGRLYVERISKEYAESPRFTNEQTVLTNGKRLMDMQKDNSGSTGLQQLTTLSNNINQSYSEFYAAKAQYQRTELLELLLLELELDDIVKSTTMSQGRDNVKIKN